MPDLFSSSSASQATTNQQVGAQGGGQGSTTIASGGGTTGAGATGQGNLAVQGSNLSNSTISIVSADPGIVHEALAVSGHAIDANTVVSTEAIGASASTTQQALQDIQTSEQNFTSTLAGVVSATQQIASNSQQLAYNQPTQPVGITSVLGNLQSSGWLALAGVAIALLFLFRKP
jgi:hypothetical protein